MGTVAFGQLFKKNVKFTVLSLIPRPPLTMLCFNMLCKQVKILSHRPPVWCEIMCFDFVLRATVYDNFSSC